MTREEAIKMLTYNSNVIHRTINGETDPREVKALDMAIEALEQSIRPKGKWINDNKYKTIWICSICKTEAYWDTDYGQQLFRFCPYCGAELEEEEIERRISK